MTFYCNTEERGMVQHSSDTCGNCSFLLIGQPGIDLLFKSPFWGIKELDHPQTVILSIVWRPGGVLHFVGRKQHVGNKPGESEVCLTIASPQYLLGAGQGNDLFFHWNLHNLIFPQNKVEKQFTLVWSSAVRLHVITDSQVWICWWCARLEVFWPQNTRNLLL